MATSLCRPTIAKKARVWPSGDRRGVIETSGPPNLKDDHTAGAGNSQMKCAVTAATPAITAAATASEVPRKRPTRFDINGTYEAWSGGIKKQYSFKLSNGEVHHWKL